MEGEQRLTRQTLETRDATVAGACLRSHRDCRVWSLMKLNPPPQAPESCSNGSPNIHEASTVQGTQNMSHLIEQNTGKEI